MERTRGQRALGVVVGGLLVLAGCGTSGDEDRSGPTADLVRMQDPVNDAFSISVPKGWANLVYSTVEGQVHHEVVSSLSPDGGTVLFIGDPKIPQYWNPDTANPVTVQFAEWLEFMELRRYVPAPDYAPEYARAKFAELPEFQITGIARNPHTETSIKEAFAAAGLGAPTVSSVTLAFGYRSREGNAMRALVVLTTIDSGPFWQASVVGLSTDRDPATYLPMLTAMTKTQKTNPDFIAAQDARHEATMAQIEAFGEQMTQQHEANMAWIQQSATAHQEKMEVLWASNDASVESYMEQMAASDLEHREVLNYVNDEHTVANSSGQLFQVDDGYEVYWMNVDDGTYVGGDINFDEADLIAAGLDPSSYEQVQIVHG